MQLIDGRELADKMKAKITLEVKQMKESGMKVPHLAAVLVGDNPGSQSYVRNKVRYCDDVGFESTLIKRDSSISEGELLEIVKDLNEDEAVDGFIVQLPPAGSHKCR